MGSRRYLALGDLWLCLSLGQRDLAHDYTHYAFGCVPEQFGALCEQLRGAGATAWQDNRSEGESYYFLDPDQHRLELHIGDLTTRLNACRQRPYAGMTFGELAP